MERESISQAWNEGFPVVFSEPTVTKLPIMFSKTDFIQTSQSSKSLYLTLFRSATVPIQLVGSGILGQSPCL